MTRNLLAFIFAIGAFGMISMHQAYAAIDDSPTVYEYKTYSSSEDCNTGCTSSDFSRANSKLNGLIAEAKNDHGEMAEIVQMNVSATQQEGYFSNYIGVFILVKYPKPKTQ